MKIIRIATMIFIFTFLFTPGQAWAALYDEIQESLICPACLDDRMTVAACNDSTAEETRQDIQKRLAAGETKEQIINSYVVKYGETILTVPATKGFNIMAWVVPILAFVGGTGLVYYVVTRWVRQRPGRKVNKNKAERTVDKVDEERLNEEILKYL